jgi:hypothetical protein
MHCHVYHFNITMCNILAERATYSQGKRQSDNFEYSNYETDRPPTESCSECTPEELS